jgi:hypothetical protein
MEGHSVVKNSIGHHAELPSSRPEHGINAPNLNRFLGLSIPFRTRCATRCLSVPSPVCSANYRKPGPLQIEPWPGKIVQRSVGLWQLLTGIDVVCRWALVLCRGGLDCEAQNNRSYQTNAWNKGGHDHVLLEVAQIGTNGRSSTFLGCKRPALRGTGRCPRSIVS